MNTLIRCTTFVSIGLLFATTSASAAEFKAGEEVFLEQAINDDLYVAGGMVEIGEVDGDVIAAGGEVEIRGPVSEDVIVAAGNTALEGDIKGDARIFAGDVTVEGDVGDDLIVTAGRVDIEKGVVVEGDVIVNAGDVKLEGIVNGDVVVHAGNVIVRGLVKGNLSVDAENVHINGEVLGTSELSAYNIKVGESAVFRNNVLYWVPEDTKAEPVFDAALINATATYDEALAQTWFKDDHHEKDDHGMFKPVWFLLFSLIPTVILAMIFIFATKTIWPDTAKALIKKPVYNGLIGLAYFVLLPVIAVLCMITVIGLPVGLFLLSVYAFSIYLAKTITAVVLAYTWQEKYKKKWNKWQLVGVSTLIFVIIKIVCHIPFLGFLITMLAVFCAYGAHMQIKAERMKKII